MGMDPAVGQDATGLYPRPQSSTSLSPPAPGLVVPQPINPRLPNSMNLHCNGASGARKYQCKMCPQVKAPMYNDRRR